MPICRATITAFAAAVPSLLPVALVFSAATAAAEAEQGASSSEPTAVQKESSGLLSLPDFSGDISKRPFLFGDLDGRRTEWAEKGVTFGIDSYSYFQSVTDGGVETDSETGGVIDWNLTVDFARMGLTSGLLQVQAVSRYGNSVNGITGNGIPVNAIATTPTTSTPNENVTLYLPVINYTHFFSKSFALLGGKINTYPQSNEFSGGNGKSQFLNLNLVAPVAPLLIIPYSTLAAGALIMPTTNLQIQLAVGTSEDTSNDTGFDDISDGKFGLFKIAYQYQLADLPGGVVNQFGYGWDSDFTDLNGGIVLPGELEPSNKNNTWFNSASFWQYLWVEGNSGGKVDPNNGKQDLQGIGLFSRYQVADNDTNPLDYSLSVGFSGKGLIPGRDSDTMGIAFNRAKLDDSRIVTEINLDRNSSVWEVYYNLQITPAIFLTFDAQVADGILPSFDTATILGARLGLHF